MAEDEIRERERKKNLPPGSSSRYRGGGSRANIIIDNTDGSITSVTRPTNKIDPFFEPVPITPRSPASMLPMPEQKQLDHEMRMDRMSKEDKALYDYLNRNNASGTYLETTQVGTQGGTTTIDGQARYQSITHFCTLRI
jgi:hypothetical protein